MHGKGSISSLLVLFLLLLVINRARPSYTCSAAAAWFLRVGGTPVQPVDGHRHGGFGDGVFLHGIFLCLYQAVCREEDPWLELGCLR